MSLSKNAKIGIVVAVVVVLAGSGIAAGYLLAPNIPNPCAGVPESPGTNTPAVTPTSDLRAGAASALSAISSDLQRLDAPAIASPASSLPTWVQGAPKPSGAFVIPVVAGENFWGSLIGQLGGRYVNVTSIITDPNTDPHEYESNDSDAIAIAHAQYIILNNVGYDTWANALIAADGATNQTILNIGNSLGVFVTGGIVTGNPHLWYNPNYVNQTVAWMYHNLTTIEPGLTGYFTEQYDNLTSSLTTLYDEVGVIKHLFGGTEVASTESIFVYLANATGLDLVSPPAFMEAVAESNDPSDQSIVTFQCQLESGYVKVLVFNAQTVTPITTSMKEIAQAHNVTVMSVTETIVPPTDTFQVWMGGELSALYVALDAGQLGE
jgi:zinc/manganese transport system substrate-binding protein